MIYDYTSIRAVHLEITDRCNAACPMCPRFTPDGNLAPQIQGTQITLEDFKSIFSDEFIAGQLERVNFCGNYGDPIVARDTLSIISHLRSIRPHIRVEVNTNGSARPVTWWQELASLMGYHEQYGGVWFGLDGLADTNHVYRRNTNWDIIMRNVEAFIKAGGIAYWNFIAFKHNEHQIEDARRLSEEMGFRHFNVKLTGRFNTESSYPVFSKGKLLYDLEPAEAEAHQRPVIPRTLPAIPVATKPPTIECTAQKEASIYLAATGHVYPCCWIGDAHHCDGQLKGMSHDNLDARKRPLHDIVSSSEFQMIEDSWADGSIHRCVQFCGVNETDDKHKYGPDYVIRDPRRPKPQ